MLQVILGLVESAPCVETDFPGLALEIYPGGLLSRMTDRNEGALTSGQAT